MKNFIIGLLALGTFSAFADTLEFCKKDYSELSRDSLELVNKGYGKQSGNSTRIACGRSEYGNYLWVNSQKVKTSYMIFLEEECLAIIASMEANPRVVYEFEINDNKVTKVTKSKVKKCDIAGNVASERTILDL